MNFGTFQLTPSTPVHWTSLNYLNMQIHFIRRFMMRCVYASHCLQTTCTIERSFSTLRRVKTWLRSTMSDERLSALCMMSVHKERIEKLKTDFVEEVMKRSSIQD